MRDTRHERMEGAMRGDVGMTGRGCQGRKAGVEGRRAGARTARGFLAVEPPTVTHNDLVAYVSGGRPALRKSARLREAEGALTSRMAAIAPEGPPLSGALSVEVRLCFARRGRHAQGEPMCSAPDVDNSAKTILDCLVRAGVMADDRLVVDLRVSKAWSDPAGIWVRVSELQGQQEASQGHGNAPETRHRHPQGADQSQGVSRLGQAP